MPRKRKTRAVTKQSQHPDAKLPDGSEGQDLNPEERQNKLLVMIADFENEVATRIKALESQKKNCETRLRTAYTLELMHIPKHIREMKITEYLETGGKSNNDEEEDTESTIDAKVQSVVKEAIQRKPLAPVNEESDTVKKSKPPISKRGRPAINKAGPQNPPSTAMGRKTRQRMFETPVLSSRMQSRPGFETPLVTPKFDTRLPITPAIGRNPKPNERIMSITGSPIYLSSVHRGQKPDLFEVMHPSRNIEEIADSMDHHTMNDLVKLQEKLTKIIQSKQ